MGTAQSSTAKSANAPKKSKAASSGSGRKTKSNRASLIAPELQEVSDVSFQHHDITMEDSAHLEDDHPVMIVEESLSMESTDSESEDDEEDGTC